MTSRWPVSSSPTAPSISSSVPSRMLASGVFSSCDMCRRNRLRSCASSSSRLRSHSSWCPSRSRSTGPSDDDVVGEIAAAELADGAIDLSQRPAQAQREQQHHDQHQRQQQRGFQEQLASRAIGLRAAAHRHRHRSAGCSDPAMPVARSSSCHEGLRQARSRLRLARPALVVQHQRRGSAPAARSAAAAAPAHRRRAAALTQRCDDRRSAALIVLAKGRQHRSARPAPGRAAPSAPAARSARTCPATAAWSARCRPPAAGWCRPGAASARWRSGSQAAAGRPARPARAAGSHSAIWGAASASSHSMPALAHASLA